MDGAVSATGQWTTSVQTPGKTVGTLSAVNWLLAITNVSVPVKAQQGDGEGIVRGQVDARRSINFSMVRKMVLHSDMERSLKTVSER